MVGRREWDSAAGTRTAASEDIAVFEAEVVRRIAQEIDNGLNGHRPVRCRRCQSVAEYNRMRCRRLKCRSKDDSAERTGPTATPSDRLLISIRTDDGRAASGSTNVTLRMLRATRRTPPDTRTYWTQRTHTAVRKTESAAGGIAGGDQHAVSLKAQAVGVLLFWKGT
jgi:hypothetical protein